VADANGNLYQNGVVSYDVENRVSEANGVKYAYSPDNLRIWRGSSSIDELTVYSMGQKLGAYNLSVNNGALVATCTGYYEYFGGKMIKNAGGYVNSDRLGSIGKFFPYGQERPSATTNGKEKFATYTRDAETGLDYAVNRYHSSGDGRFLSPDPYGGSSDLANPGSWNRYGLAGGDPANNSDPTGLFICSGCVNDVDSLALYLSQHVIVNICDHGDRTYLQLLGLSIVEIEYFVGMYCPGGGTDSGTGNETGDVEGGSGSLGVFDEAASAASLAAISSAAEFIDKMIFSEGCIAGLSEIRGNWGQDFSVGGLKAALLAALYIDWQSESPLVTEQLASAITGGGRMAAAVPLVRSGLHSASASTIVFRSGWEHGLTRNQIHSSVMHEILHIMGFMDEQLQVGLGVAIDPKNTMNISAALESLCF
jgi:RHS repeat-associated protein